MLHAVKINLQGVKQIAFFLLWALPIAASAQVVVSSTAEVDAAPTLCEQLREQGKVTLYQDARLEELLGREVRKYNAVSRLQRNRQGRHVVTSRGYRVRAFSGNNQLELKEEAYRRETEIKSYLPDLETYVLFKSPNWRLVIGNYRTQEEATAAFRKLKKQFPKFGAEMFVVQEDIELPL